MDRAAVPSHIPPFEFSGARTDFVNIGEFIDNAASAQARRFTGQSPPNESVLPALVHKFEAIAVRVKNIRSVVARVVIDPRTGSAIVRGTGSHCRSIGGVDLALALRHKTHMRRTAIRRTLPQPEEDTSIRPEPFQIRMARRPVFAVVVHALGNAEWSQGRRIERDGTLDVAYRKKNVIQHVCPRCQMMVPSAKLQELVRGSAHVSDETRYPRVG